MAFFGSASQVQIQTAFGCIGSSGYNDEILGTIFIEARSCDMVVNSRRECRTHKEKGRMDIAKSHGNLCARNVCCEIDGRLHTKTTRLHFFSCKLFFWRFLTNASNSNVQQSQQRYGLDFLPICHDARKMRVWGKYGWFSLMAMTHQLYLPKRRWLKIERFEFFYIHNI